MAGGAFSNCIRIGRKQGGRKGGIFLRRCFFPLKGPTKTHQRTTDLHPGERRRRKPLAANGGKSGFWGDEAHIASEEEGGSNLQRGERGIDVGRSAFCLS